MGTLGMWSLTAMDMEEEYDKAKDMTIGRLIDDGLLEADTGKLWAATHTFALRKPNRISKWISRVFKGDTDKRNLFLLTIYTRDEDSSD